MSALPRMLESSPLRALLDRDLATPALAASLGVETEGREGLDLARRVLHAPLADLLSRPGKAVRARLVERAFDVARVHSRHAHASLPDEVPLLLEMLHAGSLVVDDIEDDAEVRRGAPALHRTHGLPVALNAGNWLYFWPFEVLAALPIEPASAFAAYRRLSNALLRCHHGQALDVSVRVHTLARHEVAPVVALSTRLKTGSLLELACALGAIMAGASPEVEHALADLGRETGVALQMLDDLSGLLVPARLDKGREDLRAARLTWPWAFVSDAVDTGHHRFLAGMSARVLDRTLEPDVLAAALRSALPDVSNVPRTRIDHALKRLERALGAHASIDALASDLSALERAFLT